MSLKSTCNIGSRSSATKYYNEEWSELKNYKMLSSLKEWTMFNKKKSKIIPGSSPLEAEAGKKQQTKH